MVEPTELTWEAPPFVIYERGKYWRAAMIGGFVLMGAIIGLMRLYIPAIVIALGGLALVVQVAEKAHPMLVTLTETEAHFGRRRLPYRELKRFFILSVEEPVLFLEPKRVGGLPHSVVISEHDPLEIEHFLRHYLPEAKENMETGFLRLNRLIGFS